MKNILLLAGVFGPMLFVFVFLIDGATRNEYISTLHWISHLSLGERGWLGITNLIVFGVLMMTLGLSIKKILNGTGSIWGIRFLIFFAIGLIAAGMFVIEPNLGYPNDLKPKNSISGQIHDLSGGIVFTSLAVLCFIYRNAFSERFKVFSIISGLLVIISFITCTVLVSLHFSGVYPNSPSGFFERVSMIAGCLWITIFSFLLYKRCSSKKQDTFLTMNK